MSQKEYLILVLHLTQAKKADGARRKVNDVLDYLINIPEVKEAIRKEAKIKLRFAADG